MIQKKIFKKGSKTYYWSTFFFPKKVKRDVTVLYAFVRIADDFVDQVPPRKDLYYAFKDEYYRSIAGGHGAQKVIRDFVMLQHRKQIEQAWVDSFFSSMEMDLKHHEYRTMDDTLRYMYGSAEVIGLMMNRVLGVAPKADFGAQLQGRAMQYINFIRDIKEDMVLGRTYIPLDIRRATGVDVLRADRHNTRLLRQELGRYHQWQKEARTYYKYIPRRYRVAIMTAADMYEWTAFQIQKDPQKAFKHKVKPSKLRILVAGLRNLVKCYV